MNSLIALSGAFGLGAASAHFFDPQRGRRRRSLATDQVTRAVHTVNDALTVTARDIRNRVVGRTAAVRSRMRRDVPSDPVLAARVSSRLGGFVRHPGAIDVEAHHGRVTLQGIVRAGEADRLVHEVRRVRGVRDVDDRLRTHRDAAHVPSLHGDSPRSGRRSTVMPKCWSPTARLAAGAAGALLAISSARASGAGRPLVSVAGLALIARAVTNLPFARLIGVGAGRYAVTIQKTITVVAPLEETFAVWSRYENFPRFMEHVLDVRRGAEGRSRWTVRGPGGRAVHWDAVETLHEPNRRLGWKTLDEAAVAHAGTVRFEPTPDGGTRVHVTLSYDPPAGAFGHAIAALLGQDPKQALDEDLVRLKSLLEGGRTRAHGRRVTRADVRSPRRDDVGRTGIWPASGPLPPGDAPIVGQGELGTAEYEGRVAETPPMESEMATDPVCGRAVGGPDAMRSEHGGHVYYFDSVECRRRFEEAPARYTTAIDRRRLA